MVSSRLRALAAAALLPLVLLPQPQSARAAAATATPTAAVAPVVANAGGEDEQEPTQAEIDAARTKVKELTDQEESGSGTVADTRRAVQHAAQEAGLALETYTAAVRRLTIAQAAERTQQDRLTGAQAAVDQNREQLGRWARQAYQDGGLLSTHSTLNVLLQVNDGSDVGTALNVLQRIGTERNHALDATEQARRAQSAAADAAASASEDAAAAVEATDARNEADAALAQQRTALGKAQTALSGTRSALSEAKERQTALEAAQALSGASSYVGGASGADNRVTGRTGACAGGADIQQYPNGQIPVAALCPLATAPGHHLRADAAYAFDRMSTAYAQRFGAPICVTDSYRSLAAQIDVKRRKPGLAAQPGTSNHGWGTATDLCGGIQSFSSAQHHWMQLNAPLYGWFHPAWAQADGSKPEPWHWEYAG